MIVFVILKENKENGDGIRLPTIVKETDQRGQKDRGRNKVLTRLVTFDRLRSKVYRKFSRENFCSESFIRRCFFLYISGTLRYVRGTGINFRSFGIIEKLMRKKNTRSFKNVHCINGTNLR